MRSRGWLGLHLLVLSMAINRRTQSSKRFSTWWSFIVLRILWMISCIGWWPEQNRNTVLPFSTACPRYAILILLTMQAEFLSHTLPSSPIPQLLSRACALPDHQVLLHLPHCMQLLPPYVLLPCFHNVNILQAKCLSSQIATQCAWPSSFSLHQYQWQATAAAIRHIGATFGCIPLPALLLTLAPTSLPK